ncbi:linalool dehydratase/isomerase domain-containing protein [Nocardia sp. NPDC004582]
MALADPPWRDTIDLGAAARRAQRAIPDRGQSRMTTGAPYPPSGRTRQVRAPLPEGLGRINATTRRKLLRAMACWGAVWLASAATVVADISHSVTAFALGLVVPGGGLLYGGHPLLMALTWLGCLAALFAWWAFGPVVLPPLLWVASALLGAAKSGPAVWSWAAAAVLATPFVIVPTAFGTFLARRSAQRRCGREVNARLASHTFTITGAPAAPPVAEHSAEDLAALRYALDLALQPLDHFDGFTRIDQFREAALRYQLNELSYALATAQYSRTPAFTGYLAEAQRNAIEKMLDRRVWGYWALENLWGNLRWNPDPADRENIMLTGYLGQMVGMYETLNDDRYSAPGALTFRWNDRRVYPNSFATIAESVHRNMIAGDYTLYPCEPNWVYTVCNTFGLNTLLTHDRLHGTALTADVIDRLHRAYESEFLRPDGRIIGVRSARLGGSWNFWAGPAIQLTTALWLHAGLPEYAQRAWWLVRDQEIRIDGDRVGFPPRASSRVDPGNYRLGGAYGQVMIASAAREMGGEDVARTALAGIEELGDPVHANGVRYYAGLSGLGNMYALQFRFNRAAGLRDQIAFGAPPHWRTGPVLAEAAYPEVQVARAVTDGRALDLVLRPGNGLCRTTVRIARLEPGRAYRVAGAREAEFTASLVGEALIDIDLGGRHEVHITPR